MTGPSILYAEDDDHDVFFLKRAFEAVGIHNRVEVACDGEEAVEYLSGVGKFADRGQFPLPSLVILDLKMPRRNGLEVLEWLRQRSGLPQIPVIMFSSSGHDTDIDRGYELGANAFVVKPSSVHEREEFARAVKHFWLRFNQAPPSLGRYLSGRVPAR